MLVLLPLWHSRVFRLRILSYTLFIYTIFESVFDAKKSIQAHVILLSCFASSYVWRVTCQTIAFALEISVLNRFSKVSQF